MCLLTFMQRGVTADIEDLRRGAAYNDDGFGFAVHAGSSVITGHGMVFDDVLDQFLHVRAKHDGVALFHSRITTHGKTDVSNCHPFRVGGDNLTVVGHNGMLPIQLDKNETRSDTRIFAENYLPSLGGVYALDDPTTFQTVSQWARGSKLVVITANQWANSDHYILNEKDGHWVDGVWWSNFSYCYESVKSAYGYGNPYSSGWGGTVVRTPKDSKSDYVKFDDEEAEYWNLYEVTCPVCETKEVFDLDYEDPIVCETCGYCMWCQQWCGGADCRCEDATALSGGPEYRKLSADELADWVNFSDADDVHDATGKWDAYGKAVYY